MTEKLIHNGNVAVLFSPGFGAGWSTWNGETAERMVFDPIIAQMILDGIDKGAIAKVAQERYPLAYMGGLANVTVKWLPVDTLFTVVEYDGCESIRTTEDLTFRA